MGRFRRGFAIADLTDEELLLLDGECRPNVQQFVDRAKSYFAKKEAGKPEYLAIILAEAERLQYLDAGRSSGGDCARCGKRGWHDPLYVRGPKKGQRNPRKRRVHHPCVRSGDLIFCLECWPTVFDMIKVNVEPLYEVKIEGIETKAIIDHELECNNDKCKLKIWRTDTISASGHRCPAPGCGGFLRQPRNGEVRLIEVAALKAAKRMMQP